jgi:DNA invertase Pin-like site-specific DNA recombinase
MSAIAQFELSLVKERTVAGIAAARAKGVRVGRPPVMNLTKITAAKEMNDAGMSTSEIAEALGVSRRSIYRALQVGQTAA